jgi:tetratricopeptide (TPR) repeat protein
MRDVMLRFALLTLLLASLASSAYADPKDDCEKGINWDVRIAACTLVIESKEPAIARGLPQAIPHLARASAYSAKGDHDRAIADLTQAIAYNPDQDYYILRGDAYVAKGDCDKAIADYTHAISTTPGTLDPDKADYLKRAEAHACKGDYERAIADFTRAIDLSKRSGAEDKKVYFLRGLSRFESGDFWFAAYDLGFAYDAKEYSKIFHYLAVARSRGEAVPAILKEYAASADKLKWPFPVVELLLEQRTPEETLGAASDADQKCEAHFYIGQSQLMKDRLSDAKVSFETAVSACPKGFIEYRGAVAELERMKK